MDKIDQMLLFHVLLFEASCPGNDAIPHSASSLVAHLAADEAKQLYALTADNDDASRDTRKTASDFDIDTGDIPQTLLESDEFLLCYFSVCNGYLATQYSVRGHWATVNPEFDALKRAFADSLSDSISLYNISGNLDIGVLATARTLKNSKTRFAHNVDETAFYRRLGEDNPVELTVLRCVTLGAAVWHAADKAYSAKSTTSTRRTKIFVSYSHNDKLHAEEFQKMLESAGYNVWRDIKDIPIGLPISDGVITGISQCDYMVLLMSKNSLKSPWVAAEIKQAHHKEIRDGRTFLLPVRLDDTETPANLEYIDVKRYGDGRVSIKKAGEQILAALAKYELSTPQ